MRVEKYRSDVEREEDLRFLLFHSSWSIPSKYMLNALEKLEVGQEYVCYAVNVDEHLELARKYKVAVIPTMLAVKGEEIKGVLEGYKGIERLRDFIRLVS